MTAPSSERPTTLDDIVRQAESLSEADRLSFLKQACANDDHLLSQAVERLRYSSPQWWDHSIESRAFDPAFTPERTGETIGPYRVLRTLGEGGMGEVFLAERDDKQFRRQVAIKLVKRGALSRNVQGRLKAERQILATLDHPNIARLLDGGATADGTPYIVMEYIEGQPIDVYCDSRRLTVEARLKLFRIVCAAVLCAHQNLIVHRDLKQSNILVTREGIPKLLDFGIAKILDERQLLHTMAVTQLDMRVMTPEHASPEQIRGDPVTTASDIYALGVLLYELLAGHKPYELKSSRLSEIEDAICEREPLALDASLPFRGETVNVAAKAICEARSIAPARLRRELRGDLSNIVMTALRKEPDRRYPSVEQFSADIERYLTGMPVAASKDSWQYRARKFVRRHRVAVAAASFAFLGLATFAIVTTVQANRIAREQARTAQISSFLIDMFEQADPTHSRGREISVREMLDIGSRRIASQLADQPDTRALLQETVGKVYADLGLYDEAEHLFRDAIAVRSDLYGPENPITAASMQDLGDVLVKKKSLRDAEPLLQEALEINKRAFGENSVKRATGLRIVGELRQEQQQPAIAEDLLRESLRILTGLKPKDAAEKLAVDTEMWATLNRLAILLGKKGDYAAAEQMYRRALDVSQQSLGRDHPRRAFLMQNLALAVEAQGRLDDAQPLYTESLEIYRQVLGPTHPETLIAMANYGQFLYQRRDFDGAERTFREVLESRTKVLGARHSRVGYDKVNLGLVLHEKGRYAEAETLYRDALGIYEETLPGNHTFKGAARRSLGLTLIALGKYKDAEQELKRAVEIYSALQASDSPQIAMARGALGAALAAQKRYAEAEPLLLENYRLLRKTRSDSNPAVVRMRAWIVDLYKNWNRPEQAEKFFASVQAPPQAPRKD